VRDFRQLKAWGRAHRLTLAVYKATATFPRDELYGLTTQMRRSCASIPTNIAEGCGRSRDAEFARFLQMAMGSASELGYQLLLAQDLGPLDTSTHEQVASELSETKRMLNVFIQKVRRSSEKPLAVSG